MKHKMRLQLEPFNQIKKGNKTIELRLYDEKRKKLSIGDKIIFTLIDNKERELTCEITNLYIFSSFKEVYENLPIVSLGYDQSNTAEAHYRDMEVYYSKEAIEKYGVIAIEIILID